ncbi:MAG: hypothetical protein L6V84_07800 [Oscillospiraceae bacterium]|nr:MAG: hypothetical protein L6V84_07800 [Oscillospiraceae bacterium]
MYNIQDANYGANNFIRMLEEENISGNFFVGKKPLKSSGFFSQSKNI